MAPGGSATVGVPLGDRSHPGHGLAGAGDEFERSGAAPGVDGMLDASSDWPMIKSPSGSSFLGMQRSCVTSVPHVHQRHNWDCGVACVLMVLKALGRDGTTIQDLYSMINTESVWTIDLALALKKLGVDATFYTITLGANPDFVREGFYCDNMEEDQRRVENLFRTAPTLGLRVEQRSIPLSALVRMIAAENKVVIVLVDKRLLTMAASTASGARSGGARGAGGTGISATERAAIDRRVESMSAAGYTGHYVLLSGVDTSAQHFIVADPATACYTYRVDARVLDRARMSFGTDEDMLVIDMKSSVVSVLPDKKG